MSSKKSIYPNFIEMVTVGSSSRVKIDSPIFTGNVGIGTSAPRVAFDILSTDALLLPAGTDAQRPSTLMKGLLRYNTTADKFEGYSGSWTSLGSATITPITITAVTSTIDGWTVTTNNVAASGDFQVHVTPAYDDSTVIIKATPFFTSATAITTSTDWPSGTGWSVSANVNSTTAWYAFNSSTAIAQNWGTGNSVANLAVDDYITVKYPSANKLSSVSITSIWNNGAFPGIFYIQGSHNGLNFVNVQMFSGGTWTYNVARTFAITEQHVPYMYWRLYIDTNAVTANSSNFTDIRFNTIWSSGRLVTTAYALNNKTQFNIVMADIRGDPVSMITQVDSLKYNIMIIKGRNVVLSGLYQFSGNTVVEVS